MLTYPVHLMWSNFSPNSSDKEVVMSAPPWMLTKHRLPSPSQASAASSPPVPLPPPPPPPPVSLPTPPTVPPPPTLPLPSPPRTKSRVSDVLDLIGLVLSGFFFDQIQRIFVSGRFHKYSHCSPCFRPQLGYYRYDRVLRTLCDSFTNFTPALYKFAREL